jgi:hypothetical protein
MAVSIYILAFVEDAIRYTNFPQSMSQSTSGGACKVIQRVFGAMAMECLPAPMMRTFMLMSILPTSSEEELAVGQ